LTISDQDTEWKPIHHRLCSAGCLLNLSHAHPDLRGAPEMRLKRLEKLGVVIAKRPLCSGPVQDRKA
jgi:hypothetical protein